ncbi:MAG TPA: hypothetical protein VGM19_04700 [Armatimonadota bacterium]|jgi:hypothetical protein
MAHTARREEQQGSQQERSLEGFAGWSQAVHLVAAVRVQVLCG